MDWLRRSFGPSKEERAGVAGRERWLAGAGVAGADESCIPGMLLAGDGGGKPEATAAQFPSRHWKE